MARRLTLLSVTEFENRVPDDFPVGCPTLDLSVTREGGGRNVLVCRPPGQVVSKIHQVGQPGSKPPEPLAVTWKPDGQFLAVGWSDGVVRLMGLENSRAAHRLTVCSQADGTNISHISWACTQITSQSSKPLSAIRPSGASPDESGLLDGEATADLPRELTFLEIDTALPKISPLPGGSAGSGEDATVFTLRTGIDFLFQTPRATEYDQVNVMIVGSTDGGLHLSIHDSFVIGSFPSPLLNLGLGTKPHLIHVASSPRLSTHALLMAEKKNRQDELHLVSMDLPFISSVPINLSLLSSKLTMLQKLLRYLRQTQMHMQLEWKNTRDLPSRFLSSVQSGLEELTTGPRDVVSALYHTVVTGHVYQPMREWLLDSVAERGHKRWDKAVVSGLESLRSLVHENFLPVLERCSVILSRLHGLAQFHDDREDIGFTVRQVTKIMDVIGCLTLVGHKILLLVMDELDHFAAFSQWIRFQIDRLASSSPESEELTEKEATMDNGKVLTYIEHYLTKSPLQTFLGEIADTDRTSEWERIADVPSLLNVLKMQLTKQSQGQESTQALPHVEFLTDYAFRCSDDVFHNIAETKKHSVRFGPSTTLSIGHKIDMLDLRMCDETPGAATVYAALSSKDASSQVHLFRAGLSIFNGISSSRPIERCILDIGASRKLIDLGFLGDDSLVLLCAENDNTPVLVTVPTKSTRLQYSPFTGPSDQTPTSIQDDFMEYNLPEDISQRPIRMQLHDRADVRGEIASRICLLGSNKTTWQTFTLPTDNEG